ncbi:hypothetical protein IFM89_022325 [Coptis chinensis]|uniref:FAR1 domain-containing protein n=1 Tax=Coptis chinensis TaxID=261450 RepID=A0A835I4M2_9MAGN|nr:hypothetical protein IFM89_022325 [Coptis chinensis]
MNPAKTMKLGGQIKSRKEMMEADIWWWWWEMMVGGFGGEGGRGLLLGVRKAVVGWLWVGVLKWLLGKVVVDDGGGEGVACNTRSAVLIVGECAVLVVGEGMDDFILIDEVGEQEKYGSVPKPSAAPSVAFSSSVQPPKFEVEVEIVKPPCLGMCFETLEVAKQFYTDYGKSFGFSPIIRSSEKSFSRSDEVSSCQMTCERFGVYRDRGGKNKNVDGTNKEVRKRNTNTVKLLDVELEDEYEENEDEDGEENEDDDTNDDGYD